MSANITRTDDESSDGEWTGFIRSPGGLLVMTLLGSLGGCFGWLLLNPEDVIAAVDCGRGRELVISRNWDCDEAQSVYYVVKVDGRMLVPRTEWGTGMSCGADFDDLYLQSADGGDVIGLFSAESPGVWYVLHDFRSGISWPRCEQDRRFSGDGSRTVFDLKQLLDAERERLEKR